MIFPCIDNSNAPPCPPGDAALCRGQSAYPFTCRLEPVCDYNVPIVKLTGEPYLPMGQNSVNVSWHGHKETNYIEILVRMLDTDTGIPYSVIEHKIVPDVDEPDMGNVDIGFTGATYKLDNFFEYFISFRRVRNASDGIPGQASPWVTYKVGSKAHKRAFSKGFSIGFQ